MTTSVVRKINRGSEFLAHYASPYYDPVKAHAYYEEHKVASDKAAASAFTSQAQRDTFAVSKENIAKAKAVEVATAQANEKTSETTLSASAKASIESINTTLDSLIAQVRTDYTATPLNKIPSDATPQVRAFLERQNQAIKARAADAANQKISGDSSNAQVSQNRITNQLSLAIQTARISYSSAIAALNTKYQSITDQEKQNIHDQVPGAPPKPAPKPKKAKKKK
jgi:hypothetical protein